MSNRFENSLEGAIHGLRDELPYIGFILQCLNINQDERLPAAAGVYYNKQSKKFYMKVNPELFGKTSLDEKIAILTHEVYHIIFKHTNLMYKYNPDERMLLNYAMDLVINQLIKNLPEYAVTLKSMKDMYNIDLLPNQTVEYYFENLKKDLDKLKKGKSEGKGGDNELDEHGFNSEELTDEEKREMLKAKSDLYKRAKNNMEKNYSVNSKELDDLIEKLETQIKSLNYKKLLEYAFKKSIPAKNRSATWSKPSKRYGYLAPGTKTGSVPRVDKYLDTSGSISHEEYNTFLRHTDNFLKYTNKNCVMSFFHEKVYETVKYKKGMDVKDFKFQSGGTNLRDTFDHIQKRKADLAVIFTDGYYDSFDISGNLPPVLFIISKNGNEDHPLKHLGYTVKMIE